MSILIWNASLAKILLIVFITFPGKSLNIFLTVFHDKATSDSLNIEVAQSDIPLYFPSTGIQFYRDGIIYLLDSRYSWENEGGNVPFGRINMYYSPLKDNKLGEQTYFLRNNYFPYPAEAVTFTSDYSKMFFNKESRFRGYREDAIRIYETEINFRKNGKLYMQRKLKEFPYNSNIYSCIQPAVSPDGKFLIFASDMPGGQGGLDLYYSIYEDGNWEDPINLGIDINSPLDESFSFINNNGDLFFSSNGHEGYGKYDIYFARLIKAYLWDKPINMGPTLNSAKDDVAFTLSRIDEIQGFFASDRNVTGKQYQLFKVKINGDIKLLYQDQPPENESITKLIEGETIDLPETDTITSKISDITIDKTKTEETEKTIIDTAESEQTKPVVENEIEEQDNQKIIFKVQFKTSDSPLESFNVVINDRVYNAFEYYYKGAYRYTIGEFEKLDDAIKLLKECRKNNYSDAFVVAFRGLERILDPQVFQK